MSNKDIMLMAHLMRRVGFGSTKDELEEYIKNDYDNQVDIILDSEPNYEISKHLINRYQPDYGSPMGNSSNGASWLYKMIWSDSPFKEKISLFWHGIFATGYAKLANGIVLHDQIKMFSKFGLGNYKDLLIQLSKDPAMIIWLDNCESHKGAVNENYGRELLELFSMGTGNYTEKDIKEASRAFTGWTIANKDYMTTKSQRDSVWPYGRLAMHFEYKEDDHDGDEKIFLGETGSFNGEDIIDIICKQKATAKFISRHMYSFFVEDEPPVPEWPYKAPNNTKAIELLSEVYFDTGYNIKEMLRFLFKSEFFKSEKVWNKRVKSPIELVAGTLRITKEFERPDKQQSSANSHTSFMGQHAMNPPSVEGWHWGTEWLDSGTVVERVNFSSSKLGNVNNSGIRKIINNVKSNISNQYSTELLIENLLDELGSIIVSKTTKDTLKDFVNSKINSEESLNDGNLSELLQLIGAMPEFQRA
tara:strand:+ start:635 stop:2056 length:1422 start_codon:yes stop_codon:yes gene_type:complete